MDDDAIVLVGTLESYPGTNREFCSECARAVYVQKENSVYVKSKGGRFLCIFCVLDMHNNNPNEIIVKQFLHHGRLVTDPTEAEIMEIMADLWEELRTDPGGRPWPMLVWEPALHQRSAWRSLR